MGFFKTMLRDDSPESTIRFIFIIGSLWSMLYTTGVQAAYFMVDKPMTQIETTTLFAGLIAPFGAMKIWQKYVEKPKVDETDKGNS